MNKQPPKGFSMVELLMALALIGIVASLTIPKVLSSNSMGKNREYTAGAKQTASMMVGAFQALKLENNDITAMNSSNLTPYMNYVKVSDSTLYIDRPPFNPAGSTYQCWSTCLQLHNGAVVKYWTSTFSGTRDVDSVLFLYDPTGDTEGNNDGIYLLLYYNTGKVKTFGTMTPGTYTTGGPYSPDPDNDPSWFLGF